MSSNVVMTEAPMEVVVTHETAQTRRIEVGGVRFAYRRFGARGNAAGATPTLPRKPRQLGPPTDRRAGSRARSDPRGLPGAGSSDGEFGPTIADTARRMIGFIAALAISEVDLLGFSIGGFVAQEIALIRSALVRRLILAATGPKGGPGTHGWRQDIATAARAESSPENLLYVMFAHTDTSQAKGLEFLSRFMARSEDRDTPTSSALRDAQYGTVVQWGIPDYAALQRLTGISSPTLIVQALST